MIQRKKREISKPYADGSMSSTAFFGMLRSILRSKSRWWKPVLNCKNRARVKYIGLNKKRKWSYKCEQCKELYDTKNIAVHHRIPCGTLNSFDDLSGFIQRLYCNSEQLILLCENCHKKEHEYLKFKENENKD